MLITETVGLPMAAGFARASWSMVGWFVERYRRWWSFRVSNGKYLLVKIRAARTPRVKCVGPMGPHAREEKCAIKLKQRGAELWIVLDVDKSNSLVAMYHIGDGVDSCLMFVDKGRACFSSGTGLEDPKDCTVTVYERIDPLHRIVQRAQDDLHLDAMALKEVQDSLAALFAAGHGDDASMAYKSIAANVAPPATLHEIPLPHVMKPGSDLSPVTVPSPYRPYLSPAPSGAVVLM